MGARSIKLTTNIGWSISFEMDQQQRLIVQDHNVGLGGHQMVFDRGQAHLLMIFLQDKLGVAKTSGPREYPAPGPGYRRYR